MLRPWPDAIAQVLSAAGFGLLLWLGISVALITHGANMAALRAPQLWALILALALLAIAAAVAFSGTRPAGGVRTRLRAATPWQARRNALAAAAVVLACAVGGLVTWVAPGATRALLLGLAGMLLSATSLGAVAANAMAQAAAPGGGDRQHPLVVPIQLLSTMQTGLALMFALMASLLAIGRDGGRMLGIVLVLCLLVVAATALYWRDAGRDRDKAAGPPAPAQARADRRRHRRIAAALVAGVPALALALAAAGIGGVTPWLWTIAVATVLGTALERHAFLERRAGDAPRGSALNVQEGS
ncbi:hypothetical protein FQY83_06375 [Luteimonas marina]|uniref:Uncharacterized protein n=1 Tax=Luteimonas marina TaxID=488485 RepID=A0A5C5U9T7_9GAMM|nr:hypothetical protein [Luteimonas marina]TWT22637.1 hypothetical protein FQY83_06375 [Luteimonas marina]